MQRTLDASAVGLSALCVVHCLGLPILAAVLPLVANALAAEWIHASIVALAGPIAIFAIGPSVRRRPIPWLVLLLAIIGLSSLVGALFANSDEAETALTVCGAAVLAAAHILNWRNRHRRAEFLLHE